jgi:hypothetical protein
VKPAGRGLLGLPSSLSEELVAVGMGALRTDEGSELATAEMTATGAEVVVGVLLDEPLEELSLDELSPELSSELSEVSTGDEV